MSTFPTVRLRRTRQNETLRSLVREAHLAVEQLISGVLTSLASRMTKNASSSTAQVGGFSTAQWVGCSRLRAN